MEQRDYNKELEGVKKRFISYEPRKYFEIKNCEILYPISEAIKPKDEMNYVVRDCYWVVKDDCLVVGCVGKLCFPMRHPDPIGAKVIGGGPMMEGTGKEIKHLEIVFLPMRTTPESVDDYDFFIKEDK